MSAGSIGQSCSTSHYWKTISRSMARATMAQNGRIRALQQSDLMEGRRRTFSLSRLFAATACFAVAAWLASQFLAVWKMPLSPLAGIFCLCAPLVIFGSIGGGVGVLVGRFKRFVLFGF